MGLNVKAAREELENNSYNDVQRQTAWKWASRASASYELVVSAPQERKIVTWTMAEEYYHEAVEHAALVNDGTYKLVSEIQKAVDPYQADAFINLESTLGQDMSGEI